MPLDATGRGEESKPRNVLGGPLGECSFSPLTGYFRNGCCETGPQDSGSHTVCAVVTAAFLAFSKSVGNDLSTPRPEYDFAGLKPGDQWCLCARRWQEACDAGCAPRVRLEATNFSARRHARLADLVSHAAA